MARRSHLHSLFDRIFVYHPEPWIDRDWAQVSRLPLEDVWMDSDDGMRLYGWYVQASGSRAVLLWCHGNAGNVIHRLENLSLLHQSGLSVFLFDYRGYGRSTGTPSEQGFYQDARAAYRYVTETRRVDPADVVVFGRSLGAAVAGTLVSERRAAGLILESAFPSIAAMAKQQSLGLLARVLLTSRFPLIERLAAVHVPLLMVHGDRDEIVPIDLGRQVFDAAHEPKSWYVVQGATHNDVYRVGGRSYFARLTQFVNAVTSR